MASEAHAPAPPLSALPSVAPLAGLAAGGPAPRLPPPPWRIRARAPAPPLSSLPFVAPLAGLGGPTPRLPPPSLADLRWAPQSWRCGFTTSPLPGFAAGRRARPCLAGPQRVRAHRETPLARARGHSRLLRHPADCPVLSFSFPLCPFVAIDQRKRWLEIEGEDLLRAPGGSPLRCCCCIFLRFFPIRYRV